MSNSKLRISAPTQTVVIRARDAALNVVARGFGSIDESLEAGIYQVEYRAGTRLEQELVALGQDENFEKHNVD